VPPPDFLSCDWGTSSFRLRWVSGVDVRVLREISNTTGCRALFEQATSAARPRAQLFEEFLASQISNWFPPRTDQNPSEVAPPSPALPLLISGMASSTIGWKELPYTPLPLSLDGRGWTIEELRCTLGHGIGPVLLISGAASDVEIMRGEETQAVGLLADPAWQPWRERALLILPGTHSKHLQIRSGTITAMATFMTGELFEALSRHTILRASLAPAPAAQQSIPPLPSFLDGLHAARDLGLSQALFRTRTRAVLAGADSSSNADFLSGVLIGDEMAAACRTGLPILLAAGAPLAARYETALRELAAPATRWAAIPPSTVDHAVIAAHRQLLLQHRSSGGYSSRLDRSQSHSNTP